MELTSQAFSWLCQQGHFALPEDSAARQTLSRIYIALGGDEEVLATGRTTRLTGDFVHEPTGTLIEMLGFSLDSYKALCRRHREKSDRYRAAKEARGFGPGGRTQQRAYYDALRDVATPAMGHPPLVRIDAAHGNGAAAYRAHRDRLLSLLGLA